VRQYGDREGRQQVQRTQAEENLTEKEKREERNQDLQAGSMAGRREGRKVAEGKTRYKRLNRRGDREQREECSVIRQRRHIQH